MAVTARLRAGTVKVLPGACPNLLKEAGLYRWGSEGETPEDDHNHALAALRYLVARLDARQLALAEREVQAPERKPRPWLSVTNEELWTRLY
jgi:hypothetical protein